MISWRLMKTRLLATLVLADTSVDSADRGILCNSFPRCLSHELCD